MLKIYKQIELSHDIVHNIQMYHSSVTNNAQAMLELHDESDVAQKLTDLNIGSNLFLIMKLCLARKINSKCCTFSYLKLATCE